jgi:hypothetical protein
MVMKEMVWMEVKGQSGAALAMSPLLSSQYLDPYCVFSVSPSPHRKKVLESHICQDTSIEAKKVGKGPLVGDGHHLMSTHAYILVDSVGPPSAKVCRTTASFP